MMSSDRGVSHPTCWYGGCILGVCVVMSRIWIWLSFMVMSASGWPSVCHFLSPGQRGIKALFVQDELLRSCLALSHASSVAITTGFPTHYMHRYKHKHIHLTSDIITLGWNFHTHLKSIFTLFVNVCHTVNYSVCDLLSASFLSCIEATELTFRNSSQKWEQGEMRWSIVWLTEPCVVGNELSVFKLPSKKQPAWLFHQLEQEAVSHIKLQVTNCCCCFSFSPPDETDGPPGAIALATMLLSLGKQVTMITDRRALDMNRAIIDEAVRKGGNEF